MLSCRMWSVLLVIGSLAFAGCEPGDGSGDFKPGLGGSPEQPTGTAFTLPAGIELAATPRGYALFGDADCPPYDEALEVHGSGQLVTLCLVFRNTTDAPIDVELPPGLIFVSESGEVQNGLLTELVTVVVPADSVLPVVVASYCLNGSRGVPYEEDFYSLGPVTDDADLLDFLDLLDGLELPAGLVAQSEEDYELLLFIQAAVWEITEDGALSDHSRARLEAL